MTYLIFLPSCTSTVFGIRLTSWFTSASWIGRNGRATSVARPRKTERLTCFMARALLPGSEETAERQVSRGRGKRNASRVSWRGLCCQDRKKRQSDKCREAEENGTPHVFHGAGSAA